MSKIGWRCSSVSNGRYGPTLADVIGRGVALRKEFDELRTASDREADLQRAVDAAESRYFEVAGRISARRVDAAGRLSRDLVRSLADLAMERTRCEFRFQRDDGRAPAAPSSDHWTARGYDRTELYLSPNPGEDVRPLARVASGGELSRIMLALKTLVATDVPGKTLVFDEVDAGIGGRVADVVGRRLQALAGRVQILCITHLPQIAACGAAHLQVSKEVHGSRTTTRIHRLADTLRVESLAAMMSGTVSESVRASAREMLAGRGGESESDSKGESESRSRTAVKAKAKGKRIG